MLPQEIICKKRDGEELPIEDIQEFIKGVTDERISEGQVAALCMAIFFQGMSHEERVAMTSAMATSGEVVDWGDISRGPILDKHSTGGVGDKVSLILAPIIAACGAYVPMVSGRGLGHTGGTLDKMDAIPGYNSQPDINTFKKVVKNVGCAIVGATPELAPADKRMYAIRDITGTVESQDLIVPSILSKKISAGLNGLIVDVKFGNGAFMKTYDEAKELAEIITKVANGSNLKTRAILTDMNQVLGRTAGNSLEVIEAVNYLKGEVADFRLHEVVMSLAAELLVIGSVSRTLEDARTKIKKVMDEGRALDKFAKMTAALGVDSKFVDKPEESMKKASMVKDVFPYNDGVVSEIDTRAIGMGIVEMGGGRTKATDTIDHSVGLTNIAQIGEKVSKTGRPLATIHAKNQYSFRMMEETLREAYTIVDRRVIDEPVIKETIYEDQK